MGPDVRAIILNSLQKPGALVVRGFDPLHMVKMIGNHHSEVRTVLVHGWRDNYGCFSHEDWQTGAAI